MSHHFHPRQRGSYRLAAVVSSVLLLAALLRLSSAQVRTTITPDDSLGTTVTPQGTSPGAVHTITGGRPSGSNLFHSFDRFSVGTKDIADFQGQAGIQNILSRVTGGQVSEIDGILRSTMSGVNLYLLNPSGVLFGPNARLDVQGSFHVSTADYLRLADGTRFFARLSDTNTLSVAAPEAFGFLSAQPNAIHINGSELQVREGKTLSVVGGDIEIMGQGTTLSRTSPSTLGAPGGRLYLASVAAAGEVIPGRAEQAPSLDVSTIPHLGQIRLVQDAFVDARGPQLGAVIIRGGRLVLERAVIAADTQASGPAGTVDLQAQTIDLSGGALITSGTSGSGAGGTVRLTATETLTVRDSSGVSVDSTQGGGPAGTVDLQAQTIALSGGALITSRTTGAGAGGAIRLTAMETLRVQGPSIVRVDTQASGPAGTVDLQAQTIDLSGGARITSGTGGSGAGGTVRLTATETLTVRGADPQGNPSGVRMDTLASGPGGFVSLQARNMVLSDGAQISSGTFGTGVGGTVQVTVTERLTAQGQRTTVSGNSGNRLQRDAGRSGIVDVKASNILLSSGAQIASSTFGTGPGGTVNVTTTETLTAQGADPQGNPSGVFSQPLGSGPAGTVNVKARNMVLSDGAQIGSGTVGSGAGGTVQVTVTERLTAQGQNTGVFGNSGNRLQPEAGQAGTVDVKARTIDLSGGARIASETLGAGRGGTVRVVATETLTMQGADSQGRPSGISTSTMKQETEAGDAGTVDVQARDITVSDGAGIRSSTLGPGQGGTVMVTATETLTLTGQQSHLKTTADRSGRGGNIVLQARTVHLDEGSTISAESHGTGNAGTISLTGIETLLLREHSAVTTAAQFAQGGAIQISARTLVRLHDSTITTSVQGGDGKAGNITIDPQFVVLQNGQIRANAEGGPGGNITIHAGVFLKDPASAVDASSKRSIAGTVDIRAPIANLSGIAAPLPQTLAAAEGLLRNRCLARLREGTVSTLVVRGREGVPTTPDGVLPGRLVAPPMLTDAEQSPKDLQASPQGHPTPPTNRLRQGTHPPGWTLPPQVLALGCDS